MDSKELEAIKAYVNKSPKRTCENCIHETVCDDAPPCDKCWRVENSPNWQSRKSVENIIPALISAYEDSQKEVEMLREDIENRRDYESYLQGTDKPMWSYKNWLKQRKR